MLKQRQISYDITYMLSKKLIEMNLFTYRNRLTDVENKSMATKR